MSWARVRKKRRTQIKQSNESRASVSECPASNSSTFGITHLPDNASLSSLHNSSRTSILDKLEVRLMPLNNEIINKAKAQGIRVELGGLPTSALSSHSRQTASNSNNKKTIKEQCNKFEMETPAELNSQVNELGTTGNLLVNVLDEVDDEILPVVLGAAVSNDQEEFMGDIADDDGGEVPSKGKIAAEIRVKSPSKLFPNILRNMKAVEVNEHSKTLQNKNAIYSNQTVIPSNSSNLATRENDPAEFQRTKDKEQTFRNVTDISHPVESPNLIPTDLNRSNSLKSHQQNSDVIDVTVEKLHKALLNEISNTNERLGEKLLAATPLGDKCANSSPIPPNHAQDFFNEVRATELEMHEIASRTARVSLTSANLDLATARNMLKQLKSDQGFFFVPNIKSEYVRKVLLSYFYFVRLKDEESCQQLQEKINLEYKETGMQECALYCTGCAFVTDTAQPSHENDCLSSHNKELNRLAKLSINDIPLMDDAPPKVVLVVRRHKIIDLVEDLESSILSQHPSIVDIKFARTFFVEFATVPGLHQDLLSSLNAVDVNTGKKLLLL